MIEYIFRIRRHRPFIVAVFRPRRLLSRSVFHNNGEGQIQPSGIAVFGTGFMQITYRCAPQRLPAAVIRILQNAPDVSRAVFRIEVFGFQALPVVKREDFNGRTRIDYLAFLNQILFPFRRLAPICRSLFRILPLNGRKG